MKEEQAVLKRSLSVWQLVILGLGFMTPMVVFDTFGIASALTDGHVPAAYIVALIALLFTACSYAFMIQAYPSAGSAYTFARKAFHPHTGFLVGWLALMDYQFLPMVNALIAKIYLHSLFPGIPSWIFVVLFVVLVTCINLFSVKGTANINSLFILFQMIMIVAFIVLAVWVLLQGKGTGQLWNPKTIFDPEVKLSSLIAGATLLCFSYLGFDAVAGFAEETENPKRTIPRALFLTVLVGGLIFIVTSYFIQAVFPNVTDFTDPDASTPEIALAIGGFLFQIIFLAAGFAGTIASAVSSQASVSRLLFAMGRDRMLPRWFSYVSPKSRTPVFNNVLVGVVSLTAIFFSLETATSFINFGALTAFTFVNLSVIAHYVLQKKQLHSLKDYLYYLLIPITGMSAMVIMWINLDRHSLWLGLTWTLVGLLCLAYATKGFKIRPAEFKLDDPIDKAL